MFGGNIIKHLPETDIHIFHDKRYHYSAWRNISSQNDILNNLKSYILFSLEANTEIEVENKKYTLNKNEYLYINKLKPSNITSNFLLVSGSEEENSKGEYIEKRTLDSTKSVSKPWGIEYWLSGEEGDFSFKYIILNPPHQTSLQYHELKEETNFLFQGKAHLVFQSKPTQNINDVTAEDLDYKELNSKDYVHVPPMTIHRLKAIETLHLYETSTPNLDDVIRIQDDSNRANGRINNEHQ